MKKIRAEYISDVRSSDFKKGTVYDNLFRPVDDVKGLFIAYKDKYGEEYALPASYFKIVEEIDNV